VYTKSVFCPGCVPRQSIQRFFLQVICCMGGSLNSTMRKIACLLLSCCCAFAAEHTIAVVAGAFSRLGHLKEIVSSQQIRLVGVAETSLSWWPKLKTRSARNLVFADWKKMIDQQKPEIVWPSSKTTATAKCRVRGAAQDPRPVRKAAGSNYKEALRSAIWRASTAFTS